MEVSTSASTFGQTMMMHPIWLQRTAESRGADQQHQHLSVRHETCRVETREGFKVLACDEIREVFRCSADGHREIIEKTESTSVRPYEQASTASSSGRYDEVVNGPLGPVVSATLGQMLDDFFQYAAELQQSLEQQDAAAGSSWSQWATGSRSSGNSSSNSSSSGSSMEGSSRLFRWWQRRKPASAVQSAEPSPQPSLQRLVRESSSDVQEI